VALTSRLRAVGALIGIEVLDHLIIGDDAYVSFQELGRW
jgi:DNA repair protein RadC